MLSAPGGISQAFAAIPASDFDPSSTIPILLSQAFTGDEVPVGGILDIAQEAPNGDNVIAEVMVFANGGFITYDFYPSAALTMQDGMIKIGDHEDLPEHPGVTAYLLWSDGSALGTAAACVPEQNIMICGGSAPQSLADAGFDFRTGAPEAMALHLADKGLTHFERVVSGATNGASAPPTPAATLLPVMPPLVPTAQVWPPASTPAPTAIVPSPTPMPPTSLPSVPASSISLPSLIPALLALSPGQAFRLYDQDAATFDGVVANSPDPAAAAAQLQSWGWQENYYRVFAADNPPRNAAGWVELSIDRFSSVDGAAQALSAYADARRSAHGYRALDLGLFADQTEAMTGQAYNGNEVSILARRGDLVIRATGITPHGDPTADVTEALLKILVPIADEPRVISPALFTALPTEANVPAGLRLTEEHARSAATIAATFPNPSEAERLFESWGWRENANRTFTGRTAAGTTRIEVSVFRLADATAARQAQAYLLEARAAGSGLAEVAPPVSDPGMRAIAGSVAGSNEATVYFCRGAELFRVTALGSGDSMSDLAQVVQSMTSGTAIGSMSPPNAALPNSAATDDAAVIATLQAQVNDLQGQTSSLQQQNAQLATQVASSVATSANASSNGAMPPGTTTAANIAPSSADQTTPASRRDGQTRADAIPVGQFGRVAGWQVMVQSYIPDATRQILDARPDIPPPPAGTQFVLINVQLINLDREDDYSGGTSGLVFRAAGNPMQGNEYSLSDSACRDIAGDVSDTLVRAGSGAQGVLCFEVKSSDASSLALHVQSWKSYDDFVWLSVS